MTTFGILIATTAVLSLLTFTGLLFCNRRQQQQQQQQPRRDHYVMETFMKPAKELGWGTVVTVSLLSLALQAIVEYFILDLTVCAYSDGFCGLWSSYDSPYQNMCLSDPYTWTHLEHGVIAVLVVFNLGAIQKFGWTTCFVITVLLEMIWEIFENTPILMEAYRRDPRWSTYRGDSILNSQGDTMACILGFILLWWVFSHGMVVLINRRVTGNLVALLGLGFTEAILYWTISANLCASAYHPVHMLFFASSARHNE